MANPNTLPKSLHTVTVLVTMARMILESGQETTNAGAVLAASLMLGYTESMDTYGLRDAAVKKLNRI